MNKSIKTKIATFLINDIVKKKVLKSLSDKQFISVDYFISRGELLHLNPPKTFSEKIQWLKIYGGLEKYAKYVDKYEVRQYIKHVLGENYLIPLIGVWKSVDQIPFDKLPQQFVLKTTHGSQQVFICQDKSKIDIHQTKRTIAKWLKEDFYRRTRERQYKQCEPKIIGEHYLENRFGQLIDYKFFCFNGKPELVEVAWDHKSTPKGDTFKDLSWNTLDIRYEWVLPLKKDLIKPKNYFDLLKVATTLCRPFHFVRVDLYSVNNRVYFGELTFTPANGLERFDRPEMDLRLGERIDLSTYP